MGYDMIQFKMDRIKIDLDYINDQLILLKKKDERISKRIRELIIKTKL